MEVQKKKVKLLLTAPTVDTCQVSPMAGKLASQELLLDESRLERNYFERLPDVEDPNQLVSFGTSGHRGTSLRASFNEAHILAIIQAIVITRIRSTRSTNWKSRLSIRQWMRRCHL